MVVKSMVFAVVVYFGSLGIATAQSPGSPVSVGGGVAALEAVGLGWNFFRGSDCMTLFDGTTTWFYLYATDGSYWWTKDLASISFLSPACQTGNWVGFHVINLSGLLWDQSIVYPYHQ